ADDDSVVSRYALNQLRFARSRCDGHLKTRPRSQPLLRLLVNRVGDENSMHRRHQGCSIEGLAISGAGMTRIEPIPAHARTDLSAIPQPSHTCQWWDRYTQGSGRHRRCQRGSLGANTYRPGMRRQGNTRLLANRAGSNRRPSPPRCEARSWEDYSFDPYGLLRSPVPLRESRAWHRKSDRVPPSSPTPSARSSGFQAPASSLSGDESRNR